MSTFSGASSREILHVSLGTEACELTSHWLNLQGLAATTTSAISFGESGEDTYDDDDALCDAYLSHSTMMSSRNNDPNSRYLIPRVLMVDYYHHSPTQQWNRRSTGSEVGCDDDKSPFSELPSDVIHGLWSGGVEPLNRFTALQDNINDNEHEHDEDAYRLERGKWDGSSPASIEELSRLDDFLRTASVLAEGSLSRFRVEQQKSRVSPSSHPQNKRHVDWDDLLEEEEEEEGEDSQAQQAQMFHQRQRQWLQSKQQLQTGLDDFWTSVLLPTDTRETSDATGNSVNAPSSSIPVRHSVVSSWRNYFMPPYNPKSILSLTSPATGAGDGGDHSYLSGKTASGDLFDRVEERLRWLLEDCDACQGVVLTTSTATTRATNEYDSQSSSGSSFFSGLSTPVLEYLSDECPTARRWVVSLQQPSPSQQDSSGVFASNHEMVSTETPDETSPSWRTRRIQNVRRSVECGLMWQDQVSLSHAVLPLVLLQSSSSSAAAAASTTSFAYAAWAAAALETATLSYRLRGSRNRSSSRRAAAKIGLNSYYYGDYSGGGGGGGAYGTVDKLSFSEFLMTLTPSPKHTVLELDALLPVSLSSLSSTSLQERGGSVDKDETVPFWQRLQEGTSVERDYRMKYSQSLSGVHRPKDVLPGSWLLPRQKGGILSSLSPLPSSQQKQHQDIVGDRSRHQHFSLISTLRGPVFTASASSSHYLTCLLEGMGIRYRPEQSMACVCEQSLRNLVEDGYAAGSYWNALLKMGNSTSSTPPILAVIGNTTRSHSHLAAVAQDMKDGLTSPRLRGFYNRDVASGILPEAEDCEEALSFCMDLRDVYRPPCGVLKDDDVDEEDF